MTTLPAARIDAEAFDFACCWLQRFWNSDSPWSKESALTAASGIGHWRDMLRGSVRFSLANRLQVLAIARGGDADAIEARRRFRFGFRQRAHRVWMPTADARAFHPLEQRDGGGPETRGVKRKPPAPRPI